MFEKLSYRNKGTGFLLCLTNYLHLDEASVDFVTILCRNMPITLGSSAGFPGRQDAVSGEKLKLR